ncbi:MAG: transglycosylase SLT domain-containing protein [Pseudohongiellaceae bacterium]
MYEDLWDRIVAGFRLDDHYSHPDVQRELNSYIKNQAYFDRIAHRATPFLYWMVEEVERRQLPTELVLLPIIESAFDPRAVSNQRAVGLWQIVAPTARMLGLQQDWWYDGRRDPIASTTAALDYLETLYDQFDQDWLLALAAYNAGEGNMRQALKHRDEETSFWDLRLPDETQTHVPRLLALADILAHAEHHEIELPEIPNAVYFRVVDPGFQIDLSIAAETADLELAVLRDLNPGYLQWATHPDTQHRILVPIQIASRFETELVSIPQEQRLIWDQYLIQPGDTLSSIARKLDTRVDVLQRVNGLSSTRIIAGRSLLIPRKLPGQQLLLQATAQ